MNRASLDRGFGRCIVLRKYGTSLKKYANRTQVRLDHAACPLHLGCPQCLPAGGSQQLYAPLFVLSHFVTMKINSLPGLAHLPLLPARTGLCCRRRQQAAARPGLASSESWTGTASQLLARSSRRVGASNSCMVAWLLWLVVVAGDSVDDPV